MPKLTTVTDNPPDRLEAAQRHLDGVKARAAEIDREGKALVAELERVTGEIPEAALDAIAEPAKAPRLNGLRARQAALPGEVEALAAARDQADRDIAEAEGLVRRAEVGRAARATVALTEERERLAGQIDAALAALAGRWAAYRKAGRALVEAFGTPGALARHDAGSLQGAAVAASKSLARGLGLAPPSVLCAGDMEYVERPDLWRSASMAGGNDSGQARDRLRAAVAGLGRAA